jgi:hypothetical protein
MMMLSANGEHLQQAACFAARVRVTIFFFESESQFICYSALFQLRACLVLNFFLKNYSNESLDTYMEH